MEQMAETVKDVSYSQLQHFISESPWEASTGMNEAASDISRLFQDYDNVCLLVDESSHSKKGNKSVGVVSPHRLALGETVNPQADKPSIKVKDIAASLREEQWKQYTIRNGSKGPLVVVSPHRLA